VFEWRVARRFKDRQCPRHQGTDVALIAIQLRDAVAGPRIFYWGFPCQHHSTNASYSSSSTCCSYQKNKLAQPGNLPKRNALSEIGEHWKEKYFHLGNIFGLKRQICYMSRPVSYTVWRSVHWSEEQGNTVRCGDHVVSFWWSEKCGTDIRFISRVKFICILQQI
jgi:hypothetical protein